MAQKRTKPNTSLPAEAGKMPPQAIELEETVIGAVMLEKDAITSIVDILSADSFYKESHKKIFQSILHLFTEDLPIDILTVTDELKKREQLEEVGGAYFITSLTSRVASAAHIDYHAHIIAQKHIQRELIRVSTEIQNRAYDSSSDVADLLDYSENALFQVAEGNIKKDTVKINTLINDAISIIEESAKREDNLSGVPSGFTQLDRMTSGWQKSDLVIVAARPSMGKTAFVLSMTRNIAVDHNRGVAIFSLEMAAVQLVNRLIVSETEIPAEKIKTGKLSEKEWQQLDHKLKNLAEAPIFIDDTPGISIFELRAKCRRLKMKHDIQVVVIDYLQLMTGPPETKGNREQEVSSISRSLKAIAKELDVPILALSQLNRSVEVRTGSKRPQLSDLRESGAIEQDADMVVFIHRPEKYGFTEDEEGNSLIGLAEIILAKHRNGAIGDVNLRFKGELIKFTDLEEDFITPLDGNGNTPTMTLGSKMNEDGQPANPQANDLSPNSGFDEEAPF